MTWLQLRQLLVISEKGFPPPSHPAVPCQAHTPVVLLQHGVALR